MIDMRVRQRDAHDRRAAQRFRRVENLLGAAGKPCINQSEAVIFAHQKAVKRPPAGELEEVIAMCRRFHRMSSFQFMPTKLILLVYILIRLVLSRGKAMNLGWYAKIASRVAW